MRIVVEQHDITASSTLFFDSPGQISKLLEVYIGSDRLSSRNEFVVQQSVRIPPAAQQNFLAVRVWLRLNRWLLILRQSECPALVVLVENP
jgi:hypothetical protein